MNNTQQLTLGSLFDGIGVFPLAASQYDITPIWASEVENAPVAITRRHFPNMIQLGDITKINGGEIPPVHIITFGSPCQNLSNIGNREGLAGSQSGLFFEALRIIKEMRHATHGVYPTIVVWENVMGAFSSSHRMDFKAVLEAFTNTEIPMPDSRTWAKAGMVRKQGIEICWRLLDAQFWGTPTLPQRRRRIFLVADFGAERAKEILFKPRNMQPDPSNGCSGRMFTTPPHRISIEETRGRIPIIHPFKERAMRSTAKEQDHARFHGSFGRPTDPFPTLLAGSVNYFSFWHENAEKDGYIRQLTPLECERLMGLPKGWTAYGNKNQVMSDYARYKALGNSIAVPCAEYIMAGIADSL